MKRPPVGRSSAFERVATLVILGLVCAAGPVSAQARTAASKAAVLVDACQKAMARDDAKAAAESGQQAEALDPSNNEASLCLGVALEALGRDADAVAPLERVLAVRPDSPDALFALANVYAALDDPRAAEMLDRLVTLRPDDVDVRMARIEYAWDHDDTRRGNEEMEALLAHVSGRPDLRVTYALDLLRQWQFDSAARQLEQAQKEGENMYRVAYLLGNARWEAGEIQGALASFSNAIAIDPSASEAEHELGRLLVWMGRPQEGIPHLERAAAARRSAVTELDLGRACEAAGDLERAERAYRQAMTLEPSLSPIYYALGRLLKRRGQAHEAEQVLARYRTLYEAEQQQRYSESSHQAELEHARQVLRAGRAAEALELFTHLGNAPDALIGRARALSRLDRHADAVQVLERVKLLAPRDQRVDYLLARERAATGAAVVRRL